MLIELINKTDLCEIEECGSVSLPIYYTSSDLKFLLYDSDFIIYKAVIDNKLCGFFVGQLHVKRIHIMSLAVNPKYRRKQVGSSLINKIKEIYNDCHITLNVQQINKDAINFYLKNDFICIGEIKDYYFNLEGKDAYKLCYINNSDTILV